MFKFFITTSMLIVQLAFVTTSCATKTQTGALSGSVIGAGAGALIAESPEGALIGSAIGAIAGGLIGHALDEQEKAILQQNSPHTLQHIEQGQPLTIADIKALSSANVSDMVIIDQIRHTNTKFYLSTAQIVDLTQSDVSQKVIDYMIQTGR